MSKTSQGTTLDEWLETSNITFPLPIVNKAKSLNAIEISNWIVERVNAGLIDVQDLPLLLATYALQDPSEVRITIAGQMLSK